MPDGLNCGGNNWKCPVLDGKVCLYARLPDWSPSHGDSLEVPWDFGATEMSTANQQAAICNPVQLQGQGSPILANPIDSPAIAPESSQASRGGGIPCPRCGSESSSVKRTTKRPSGLQRIRRCVCGHKFTTTEALDALNSSPPLSNVTNLKKALTAFGVALEAFTPPTGE